MKKIFLIIMIITLIIPLAGCWNFNELNTLAIVTGMGIEKGEKEKYKISMQIMNAANNGSNTKLSESTKEVTLESEGNTIIGAIRSLTLKSSQRMLLTHLQVLIIDEEIAKEDVLTVIDWFERDPQSSKQFKLAIAIKDKPSEILEIVTPLVEYPSQKIVDSMDMAHKFDSRILAVGFDEFISNLLDHGKENALPTLTIKGNEEKAKTNANVEVMKPLATINLDSTAVFKRNKMVGILEKNETLGYSAIKNQLDNAVFSFKCDDERYGAVEVTEEKNDVSYDIKGKEITFTVDISIDGNIKEYNCPIDLTEDEAIKKIEKLAADELVEQVNATVKKTKKLKADIFGFGNMIYKKDPKTWKKLENNWPKTFAKIKTKVKVDVVFQKKGLSKNNVIGDEYGN